MYVTSSYAFRLWGTLDFRGKIVLGIISHRELKASSRDSKKNINERKDLRQAVETAKRILIKEKIDRQLAG